MNEHDLFLEALEIADPGQRDAYLDQASAGNPALRKQVQALLAAHQLSGEFLNVPALAQMAPMEQVKRTENGWADTCAEPHERRATLDLKFLQPSSLPGSLGRLGHYEIQEVLGQGGFGIVLKAFDEKLQRVVAIKVMAPELALTSPARKRFLREARAAAGIRHENVIRIYNVDDQPIPHLVMEYIAGPTLQQRLDQTGPLGVPEVIEIGQQLAAGLAAAHAQGLIHRDIKPSNILSTIPIPPCSRPTRSRFPSRSIWPTRPSPSTSTTRSCSSGPRSARRFNSRRTLSTAPHPPPSSTAAKLILASKA